MRISLVPFNLALGMIFAAQMALADDQSSSTSSTAGADVSSSSASKSSLLKNIEYQDTKTLTDPNLRASDGSLDRYSFKGSLSYNGPTVGNLSAQNQPNPDKTVGNFAQKITGSFTGNYRVDSTHSWSAGTGLIMSYPFAGSSNAQTLLQHANSGSSQYSANNPFLSYSIASRWDTLQMRNTWQLIDSTQPVYTSLGEVGGLSYANNLVYGLGQSRLALSFDTSVYYWVFGRGYNSAPISAGGDAGGFTIQQYTIGATPGMKYNFTDSFNLYTTAGMGWQNPRDSSGNSAVLQPRSLALSLGLGWAYKRDIYIAPYITTYPFSPDESTNETSLNITTTFSLL